MNKTEMISVVAEKCGITKVEAEKAVSAILESIKESLVKGESVRITGFGTFVVKERAERKGHNPRTGEEIVIPAAKLPSFKAGKALKDALK